jgi:hypothetical protein
MKKKNINKKTKRLKREIEKRKYPFLSVWDDKLKKVIIHPLITDKKLY